MQLPPNVLQLLTRLRQLACVSTLVPPDYIEVSVKSTPERPEPNTNVHRSLAELGTRGTAARAC